MKRTLFLLLLFFCLTAWANDGVYYTSGSLLIPLQETDISVRQEVLTITIGTEGYAEVDVQYEFDYPNSAKTVLMAFEANAPYNAYGEFNREGIHPFIKDFTVTINGKDILYSNAVVAKHFCHETCTKETDFWHPIKPSEWKSHGEAPEDVLATDDVLYNASLDSVISYAYAYYFDASFLHGINTVHHTYKYKMSAQVGEDFRVPYWLTPATRWANQQIDDFTLRIIDKYGKGFCMQDSIFQQTPFKATKGECWQLDQVASEWESEPINRPTLFATGDNCSVEWHCKNFRPTSDIEITSAFSMQTNTSQSLRKNSQLVVVDNQGNEKGRFIGTCGSQYLVDVQDYGLVPKDGHKVELYSAKYGKGWLVIANEYKAVNIRERPNATSAIVTTIKNQTNEIPEAYPCLGLTRDEDPKLWKQWYHIQVGNKKGFVNATLMHWDAINAY